MFDDWRPNPDQQPEGGDPYPSKGLQGLTSRLRTTIAAMRDVPKELRDLHKALDALHGINARLPRNEIERNEWVEGVSEAEASVRAALEVLIAD